MSVRSPCQRVFGRDLLEAETRGAGGQGACDGACGGSTLHPRAAGGDVHRGNYSAFYGMYAWLTTQGRQPRGRPYFSCEELQKRRGRHEGNTRSWRVLRAAC
ncbi:hypothetical protein VFPFJ_09809 [Purpureocillium lilacinum]|uniref:Uncharacterized protein n=1 Tax=Purpureocillium lilacinum TaxID=33203 RepID=A0A179GPS0_PURLI|nr:hypothetical protein VFPFJ_09809 [Purpureocillium lilacinum]OAQ79323.1 hypothetical protein VFPFJ_09809 [Purpureocillium lilacinum]